MPGAEINKRSPMMLHTEAQTPQGWRLSSWELSSPKHSLSEDVWFTEVTGSRLRLGVLDGASSTALEHQLGVISGGLAAAWTAAQQLAAKQDKPLSQELLEEVHQVILGLGGPHHSLGAVSRPQAAWAVTEVEEHKVTAWVGGDCEIWFSDKGQWRRLCSHDMLTELGRARFEDQSLPMQDRKALLEDAAYWHSTSFGRYPELRCVSESFQGPWEKLLLASDGARISLPAFKDLDAHLGQVGRAEKRDDICAVLLQR